MKPKCEEIRERAFRDGLGSPAAAEWRNHCRSCPDCRTELFILEHLERQASEERQHLGRDEVQKLLDTARTRHHPRRANPILVWGLRAACLVGLLVLGVGLLPGDFSGSVRTRIRAWLQGRPAADTPAGSMTAGRTTRGNSTKTSASPTQPVPAAVTQPAPELDHRLREMRERMNRRRESLQRLLERDFGPLTPEGAWHVSLPLALRNA
jgi:hypothetical protein